MARYSKAVWGWALYDWANSAFTTTVMAGFFPVFFKQYWSSGIPVTESTLQLGLANSAASLLIVLFAPLLGATADRSGTRKRFLALFTLLGVAPTAGLWWIGEGEWQLAIGCYVLANLGLAASLVFYDALLVNVAQVESYDRVSAFGFALGYLGGGLLFALNVAMTLSPATFGLTDAAQAVRISFVSVALWWLLFTLPLLWWVEEPAGPQPERISFIAGWRELITTFHQLRRLRPLALFLAGYWLYIDGVDTVIRMAVDFGLSLGLNASDLIGALLLTQFIGFPAAILFGRLGERLGPRRGIFIALAVYAGVVVGAAFMQTGLHFYLLAAVIGLVQGGVQSLSRSLYARMVPAGRQAEFFGFYNVMGKFAAIIGPLLVGLTAALSGEPRVSLLVLLLLFGGGAALLARVEVGDGRADR